MVVPLIGKLSIILSLRQNINFYHAFPLFVIIAHSWGHKKQTIRNAIFMIGSSTNRQRSKPEHTGIPETREQSLAIRLQIHKETQKLWSILKNKIMTILYPSASKGSSHHSKNSKHVNWLFP